MAADRALAADGSRHSRHRLLPRRDRRVGLVVRDVGVGRVRCSGRLRTLRVDLKPQQRGNAGLAGAARIAKAGKQPRRIRHRPAGGWCAGRIGSLDRLRALPTASLQHPGNSTGHHRDPGALPRPRAASRAAAPESSAGTTGDLPSRAQASGIPVRVRDGNRRPHLCPGDRPIRARRRACAPRRRAVARPAGWHELCAGTRGHDPRLLLEPRGIAVDPASHQPAPLGSAVLSHRRSRSGSEVTCTTTVNSQATHLRQRAAAVELGRRGWLQAGGGRLTLVLVGGQSLYSPAGRGARPRWRTPRSGRCEQAMSHRGRNPVEAGQPPLAPRRGALSIFPGRWRQGRDSNPGSAETLNGFRDRPIRPLWHLAVREYSGGR
jgi:hypothetical protein